MRCSIRITAPPRASLLAGLDGSGVFERVADLQRASDIDALHRRAARAAGGADRRRIRAAAARPGSSADVQVIADGRNSNTAGTAMGYVNAIVDAVQRATGAAITACRRRRCRSSTRAWYNPNLETRWYMIPGMIGTLTLIQTMMLTAMSVAREREQGTFDQLLVTPFRPVEIMAGKALPSMIVGIDPGDRRAAGRAALVSHSVRRLLSRRSMPGCCCSCWRRSGIGLLLSSVAATMQQAMLYSMLLIMPFSLLSGLTTPISSMPRALQYLTLINPLRYAIDITQRVYLEGAGLALLVPDCGRWR